MLDDGNNKEIERPNRDVVVEDINRRPEKKERVKKEPWKKSYENFSDFSLHENFCGEMM